jgi:hypothetical protein
MHAWQEDGRVRWVYGVRGGSRQRRNEVATILEKGNRMYRAINPGSCESFRDNGA